jgi:uncharacterized membrane protein YcjF (UPF0283 family)
MSSDEKPSRSFYELCYDQYKIELEEADKLYQKVTIVFILLPVLVGATVKIGTTNLVGQLFIRIDIFLYYLYTLIAWILIGVSAAFAILCVVPRTYKRIGDMEGWQNWRKRYQKYIDDTKAEETVDAAMIRDICPKLADAQTKNAPTNERRRKYFQRSVLIASISTIFIAMEGIMYLILKLEKLIT